MCDYHMILAKDLQTYTNVTNKSILIVGCGYGLECDLLLSQGAKKVVGVDVEEDIGKDYQHKQIEYCRVKAEEMTFEDDTFDISLSFATLEHVQDPKVTLLNMVKVTKPQGVIYCQTAPLWNSPFGHHKKDIFPNDPWIHVRKKSAEEMMDYYGSFCEEVFEGSKIKDHIRYIYSKDFNRMSVFDLRRIVALLMELTLPLSIRFGLSKKLYQPLLTTKIRSELQQYSDEELFTEGATIVLRKLSK